MTDLLFLCVILFLISFLFLLLFLFFFLLFIIVFLIKCFSIIPSCGLYSSVYDCCYSCILRVAFSLLFTTFVIHRWVCSCLLQRIEDKSYCRSPFMSLLFRLPPIVHHLIHLKAVNIFIPFPHRNMIIINIIFNLNNVNNDPNHNSSTYD